MAGIHILTVQGARSPSFKMLADSVSPEASLLAVQMAVFSLSSHGLFSVLTSLVSLSLLMRTSVVLDCGPTLTALF